jgi:maltose/moltooligosaccharide transporter
MSTSTPNLSGHKPRLSFWQIWNMSFGFLGIQFGFALQNANTSRIFETLGAEPKNLAFYWLAAPVTGLLVQPIVGYYSDRTWHAKWGRRRPFFAIGALLASFALIMMPNSATLWMAVGVLWIMDASINISMEPFRAFVGDMLPPSQRTTGFAMQSFFIGIGAIIASFLPAIFTWLGISNTGTLDDPIPDTVKYAFYVGAFMLFVCVMWTVFSTKEYPPSKEEELNLKNKIKKYIDRPEFYSKKFTNTTGWLFVFSVIIAALVYYFDAESELYVLAGGFALFAIAHLVAKIYIDNEKSYAGIVHMVRDFHSMPRTMVQLAVVQFFSWFALFAMWIYTTKAVTTHIYLTSDPLSAIYNQGANWVSSLFGIYNGIAAIAALFIPILAKYTSRRMTHFIMLICGGSGLISMYFISNPDMLIISMIGIGFAWASILSIPYAMLSSSLPAEKMGYYMGIFNFFIVIPQIVAGTLLGFMLSNLFNDQAIFILVSGGVSLIIAGILSLRVDDKDELIIKDQL